MITWNTYWITPSDSENKYDLCFNLYDGLNERSFKLCTGFKTKQKTECVWLSLPVFFALHLHKKGGGGILSVNVLSLNSPWKGMLKICFCFCLWNYVFKFSLLASAVQLWVHGSCLMHTVLKEAQGMDWGGHGDGGPSQVDTVMEAPVMWTCWWRPQSSGDVDTVMEAQSYSNVDMVTEAPVK